MENKKNLNPTVKDIMSKVVLSVKENESLLTAFKLLNQESFTGLPVVDEQGKFCGLLTISHFSKFYSKAITTDLPLHLPTLIALLEKLKVYSKDKRLISRQKKSLVQLTVRDIMNPKARTLNPDSPVSEALPILQRRRIDPLPIVDSKGEVAGILTRSDLLKLIRDYPQSASGLDHEDSLPYYSDNVKKFLEIFEKEFVLVSKMRTYYWLGFSLAFAIAGFLIAYIVILQINIK